MARRSIAVFALVLVLGACGPSGLWRSWDPPFQVQTLTLDGSDHYVLAYDPASDSVTVSADAANTSGNSRGVFYPSGQGASIDAESCARWAAENGFSGQPKATTIQEGAALRVRVNRDSSVDAVTVEVNVWLGAVWIFNTHTWHAIGGGTNTTATLLRSFNLASVFDSSGDVTRPDPLPWHLCAKVVGTQLSFVAWKESETRPAYGDTTHGGTVALPQRYVYAGNAGWYIAHLRADQFVVFDQRSAEAILS